MKSKKTAQAILSGVLTKSGLGDADPEARRKLLAFIEELSRFGQRVHLVGKGNLATNIEMQILDSILLLSVTSAALSRRSGRFTNVADIGSGAGFPGIVWKILLPSVSVTLFERRTKQQAFLDRTVSLLELAGASVIGEDASRFAGPRDFDIVTSKASGRMSEMAPIAARLLREGGLYVTIKGLDVAGELEGAVGSGLRVLESEVLPHGRGRAVILEKAVV